MRFFAKKYLTIFPSSFKSTRHSLELASSIGYQDKTPSPESRLRIKISSKF